MAFADLRREERIGLGIALALHVALGAALLMQPAKRTVVPPIETMTVTLSTDVGLQATAPDIVPDSAAATAPTLAPEPAPPQTEPLVQPDPVRPEPAVQPAPSPPKPVATSVPKPKPKPVPRATSAPVERPRPVPPRPAAKPIPAKPAAKPEPVKPAPAKPAPSRPATNNTAAAKPAAAKPSPRAKPAGGSRLGSDFLAGAGESATSRETRLPASQIGASAKASLFQQIAKELRPKWQPPSGPDVEDLVTKVRFRLNPDGSLSGRPEVVRQSGITDLNKPQAGRHAEQAIRAVQLAAPFDLPEEHYEAFKVVNVDFDWKLSQ